ncbi:MAG: hypothetical protein IC227_00025 [Enterococcus lacertideformus]|uniref:Uncharacterized protein n=1 Tax=Enterococcus lacertideformus TaxID=2771493 RepID=A0A931F8W4_9ENTE|nr:hypothetical protein [Enterococcus lacertideformus]
MSGDTIKGIPDSHQINPEAGYFDLNKKMLKKIKKRRIELSIKATNGHADMMSGGMICTLF